MSESRLLSPEQTSLSPFRHLFSHPTSVVFLLPVLPHCSHFPPGSRPICSPRSPPTRLLFSVFYLRFSSFTAHYTLFFYTLHVSIIHLPVFDCSQSPISFLILQFHCCSFNTPHLLFLHHPQPSTSFSCSPPCSRPGLFPLIRLSVTHTHTHTHTHTPYTHTHTCMQRKR